MPKKQKDIILIIGDWVVDEYWFLVRHHSEISSHTGFVHYRIASKFGAPVKDLCGAGHVARVLHQLSRDCRYKYDIFGLGIWNKKDTSLIKHLMHTKYKNSCNAANVNYTLSNVTCNRPPNIKLASLNPEGPSIRVVRQYHQEGDKLQQINRVDWEPWRSHQNNVVYKSLDMINLPSIGQVKYIIIHDLKKGAITNDIISQLDKKYSEAKWLIRTKDENPEWLKPIKDKVYLRVIGPEIAGLINPWDSWVKEDRLTHHAFNTINEFCEKNLILLSEHREVIARLSSNDGHITVNGKSGIKATPFTQLNWPSTFFASLIYSLYLNPSNIGKDDIVKALRLADDPGYSGIKLPTVSKKSVIENVEPYVTEHKLWSDEQRHWTQAVTNYGIIYKDNESYLEVWRAFNPLPGYVAWIKEKIDIIHKLGQYLRHFKKSGTHHLAISIQADPGSGKTLLAKSLASAFDFIPKRFDVTQMFQRDDLLDLFDDIVNAQSEGSKKILVFIDEINAFFGGGNVYSPFLAPIEEGTYVRRGRTFSLKPCIWIFVGTRSKEEKGKSTDMMDKIKIQGEKFSDFNSRMTLREEIDYKSLYSKGKNKNERNRIEHEAKLEQLYLGAVLIRTYFPDVNEVSLNILKYLYNQKPEEESSRELRNIIRSLRNVQYGRITCNNCGPAWDGLERSHEGIREQMVKLIF
jgi:hypothetical protein